MGAGAFLRDTSLLRFYKLPTMAKAIFLVLAAALLIVAVAAQDLSDGEMI